MPKFLSRAVALLLVPCLLADPVFSAVLATHRATPSPALLAFSRQDVFAEQALNPANAAARFLQPLNPMSTVRVILDAKRFLKIRLAANWNFPKEQILTFLLPMGAAGVGAAAAFSLGAAPAVVFLSAMVLGGLGMVPADHGFVRFHKDVYENPQDSRVKDTGGAESYKSYLSGRAWLFGAFSILSQTAMFSFLLFHSGLDAAPLNVSTYLAAYAAAWAAGNLAGFSAHQAHNALWERGETHPLLRRFIPAPASSTPSDVDDVTPKVLQALAVINGNNWAAMDAAFDQLNQIGLPRAIQLIRDHLQKQIGEIPRPGDVAAAFGLDTTKGRVLVNFLNANFTRAQAEKTASIIDRLRTDRRIYDAAFTALITAHLELASFLRGDNDGRALIIENLSRPTLTGAGKNSVVLWSLSRRDHQLRGSFRYLPLDQAVRLLTNGHGNPAEEAAPTALGGARVSDATRDALLAANILNVDALTANSERQLFNRLSRANISPQNIARVFSEISTSLTFPGLRLHFDSNSIETLGLHRDEKGVWAYIALREKHIETLQDLETKTLEWLDGVPYVVRPHLTRVLEALHRMNIFPKPWNVPLRILNFKTNDQFMQSYFHTNRRRRGITTHELRGKTKEEIGKALSLSTGMGESISDALSAYDALFDRPEPVIDQPVKSTLMEPTVVTAPEEAVAQPPDSVETADVLPDPSEVVEAAPATPAGPVRKGERKSRTTGEESEPPENAPTLFTAKSWDDISQIIESRRGTEKEVQRIFVDLDDTLFYSMGKVASDEWVANRVNTVGYWRAKREWRQHEERMLRNGFFVPGSRDLAARLKALKDQGVEIVGWTTRTRYDEERTRAILKSLGLETDSIIFGGLQKRRSLRTWSEKHPVGGSVLVIDNRIRNLEGLAGAKGSPKNLEPVHFTQRPPWAEATSETLNAQLKRAMARDEPARVVEFAINLLETSLQDDIDQRLHTYLSLGNVLQDLRGYGVSTEPLITAYLAKVADLLCTVQDRFESGARRSFRESLAERFFELSAQNPKTFIDFYKKGAIRFAPASREEVEKGQDYKMVINADNMYAFLEPLLAYIQKEQPEVVVIAEMGAGPFKPLIEEFIQASGLRGKVRVLALPISVKNVGDTEFEMQRWFDLGKRFFDRELFTNPEDVLIGQMFAEWFQGGGLKGKKIFFVDDNVAAGHTARLAASLLGRLEAASLVVGTPFVFGEERGLDFPTVSSVHIPGHYVWSSLGSGRDSRPPFVVETEWEDDYAKVGLVGRPRFSGPKAPVAPAGQEEAYRQRSLKAFRESLQRYSKELALCPLPATTPLNLKDSTHKMTSLVADTYADPMPLPPDTNYLPQALRVGSVNLIQVRDPYKLARAYAKLLEKRVPADQYYYPDFVTYTIEEEGKEKGFVNLLQVMDSEGRKSLVVQWIQPDFSLNMGMDPFVKGLLKTLTAVVEDEAYGYRMLLFPNQEHLVSDRNAVRESLVGTGLKFRPKFEDEDIDLLEVRGLKTVGPRDKDAMPLARWEDLARRVAALAALDPDDLERKAILEDLQRGHLSDSALELLNNGFDVSGANVYRILATRKTALEKAKAEKWTRDIDQVADYAIGQRENAILRDTKAIVQLGLVPFPGQQRFLILLQERQSFLKRAAGGAEGIPEAVILFLQRHGLMNEQAADILRWNERVKLEFQALMTLESSSAEDFYRLPPGFFNDEEGEVRQRAMVEELMRRYDLDDINQFLPSHFIGNGLSVLWYQAFGGKLENIAKCLYPGQYAIGAEGIQPLPLLREAGGHPNETMGKGVDDFLDWHFDGRPLMPGRALEFEADADGRVTFRHSRTRKILRLNLKQQGRVVQGPMVLVSLYDVNQGPVVCVFTKEDFDNQNYKLPLKTMRLVSKQAGQGVFSAEDTHLGKLDILDYMEGRSSLLPGRAFRASAFFVPGKENSGIYLTIQDRADRKEGLYISIETIRELDLRKVLNVRQDGRENYEPLDVVLYLEKHDKWGLCIRMYSVKPDAKGEKVLLDTYVYHPTLKRVVQIYERMETLFRVAKGLRTRDLSVSADCPIKKDAKGQPVIEIRWTTSQIDNQMIPRLVQLPVPAHVVEQFRARGLKLIGGKATVSLQHDPINYGAYLQADFHVTDGGSTPTSDYLSSEVNQSAEPVVLLERTLYDFAVGNLVNKQPVKPRTFTPMKPVDENGSVRLNGPQGKSSIVDELPSSLVGRRIVFRPVSHPAFETLIQVHDLEAWTKDKTRAPDALYLRDRVKERLVPLSLADKVLLKIGGEFIPFEHLPELAALMGHDLINLMYEIYPESFKDVPLETIMGRYVATNAKKRRRGRFNGGFPGGPTGPKGPVVPVAPPGKRSLTKRETDLIGESLDKIVASNVRRTVTLDGKDATVGEIEPEEVSATIERLVARLSRLQHERLNVLLARRLWEMYPQGWTWEQSETLLDSLIKQELEEIQQGTDTPTTIRRNAIVKAQEEFHKDYAFVKHIEGLNPSVRLDLYQVRDMRRGVQEKQLLVADVRGLGKTLVGLGTASTAKARTILIVVPKKAIDTWAREIHDSLGWSQQNIKDHQQAVNDPKFSPRSIDVHVMGGTQFRGSGAKNVRIQSVAPVNIETELTTFADLTNQDPPSVPETAARICLINFEQAYKHKELIQAMSPDMIIVDEAHHLKNPDSERSKTIAPLVLKMRRMDTEAHARRVLFLTGTPIWNLPPDLWIHLHLLLRGYNTTWKRFQNLIQRGDLKEIAESYDLLSQIMERNRKDVLANLPRLQIESVEVDMLRGTFKWNKNPGDKDAESQVKVERFTEEEMRSVRRQYAIYSYLLERLAAESDAPTADLPVEPLEGFGIEMGGSSSPDSEFVQEEFKDVYGRLSAVEIIRLLQAAVDPTEITGGDEESIKYLALDRVRSTLTAMGEKFAVYSSFRGVVENVSRRYQGGPSRRPNFIHGGVSMTDRDRLLEGLRHGSLPHLALTLGTGGESISLLPVKALVILDRPLVPGMLDQVIDRIHRRARELRDQLPPDATARVIFINLAGATSIDLYLQDLLALKQIYNDMMVEGMFTPEMVNDLLDLERKLLANLTKAYVAERTTGLWRLSEEDRRFIHESLPWDRIAKTYGSLRKNLAPFWTSTKVLDRLLHDDAFMSNLRPLAKQASWRLLVQSAASESASEVWGQATPLLRQAGLHPPRVTHFESNRNLAGRVDEKSGAWVIGEDPSKTSFSDHEFDVIENGSLPAMDPMHRRETLREAHRLLKKDGLLILRARSAQFTEEFQHAAAEFGFEVVRVISDAAAFDAETLLRLELEYGSSVVDRVDRTAEPAEVMILRRRGEPESNPPAKQFSILSSRTQREEDAAHYLEETRAQLSRHEAQERFQLADVEMDFLYNLSPNEVTAYSNFPRVPIVFYRMGDKVHHTAHGVGKVTKLGNTLGRKRMMEINFRKKSKGGSAFYYPNQSRDFTLVPDEKPAEPKPGGEAGSWFESERYKALVAGWFEPLVSLVLPALAAYWAVNHPALGNPVVSAAVKLLIVAGLPFLSAKVIFRYPHKRLGPGVYNSRAVRELTKETAVVGLLFAAVITAPASAGVAGLFVMKFVAAAAFGALVDHHLAINNMSALQRLWNHFRRTPAPHSLLSAA